MQVHASVRKVRFWIVHHFQIKLHLVPLSVDAKIHLVGATRKGGAYLIRWCSSQLGVCLEWKGSQQVRVFDVEQLRLVGAQARTTREECRVRAIFGRASSGAILCHCTARHHNANNGKCQSAARGQRIHGFRFCAREEAQTGTGHGHWHREQG
jgi:hypothetical protein